MLDQEIGVSLNRKEQIEAFHIINSLSPPLARVVESALRTVAMFNIPPQIDRFLITGELERLADIALFRMKPMRGKQEKYGFIYCRQIEGAELLLDSRTIQVSYQRIYLKQYTCRIAFSYNNNDAYPIILSPILPSYQYNLSVTPTNMSLESNG